MELSFLFLDQVLEGIFNPNGDDALTSIKSLLRHPLFAEVSLREDLTDVSGPLSSGEKDLLKLAKKGGGGAHAVMLSSQI